MSEAGLYQKIVSELKLPPDLKEVLETPLEALGYNVVTHEDVVDLLDEPLSHNCAQANGNDVALLYVSKEAINADDARAHIANLGVLFGRKVASLFFFTPAADFSDLYYNKIIAKKLKSLSPGLHEVVFFGNEVLEHVRNLNADRRKQFLSSILSLDLLPNQVEPLHPPPPPPPPQEDVNTLVRVLVRVATAGGGLTPLENIKSIIDNAVLPTPVRVKMLKLSGDAQVDARNMLNIATSQYRNVADEKFTVLGSLLRPLLEPGEIDPDDQRVIAGIIHVNKLYLDESEMHALAQRFQIPEPPPVTTPAPPKSVGGDEEEN